MMLLLAGVAELVDALALGASGAIHESSSLSARTFFMFNFLNSFEPSPIMVSFKMINLYWYGFFVFLGFLAAFYIVLFLGKKHKFTKNFIIDLSFYLFVFGIVGARIYDIFLEWRYYFNEPVSILKIWEGGLAIHGAIIAGLLVLVYFASKKIEGFEEKKFLYKYFYLSSIVVVGLSIGQAIGRWGNYFNQELFGKPTNLPWKIFISPEKRPVEYLSENFFHPTFLYESIGLFIIFTLLFLLHVYFLKRKTFVFKSAVFITFLYLVLASVLRFLIEFIRIDFTPLFLGLRWPQVMSLFIIAFSLFLLNKFYNKKY
jgi:phosphatidylglycerol---prolipoprotein diacylglyceryl transferase